MKIDFSQSLINLDSSPLEVTMAACPVCGQPTETRALTLMSVCGNALTGQFPDERDLSGEEKFRRFQLAMKITNEQKVDLTMEEMVLIRKLIAKAYGPLILGQVWNALDIKEEKNEQE